MFGRKKNAEGFYTGDAPASAPGFDGAEPTAYTGVPGAQQAAGRDGSQPGAAPTNPPQVDAPQVDVAQLLDQVLAQAPGFVDAPQQAAVPAAPPGAPPGAPQFTTAGTLDPETAARVQAALAKSPRMGGLGLVILIPIVIAALGGLVGIGAAIYAGVKATNAVSDALSSVEIPTAIAPGDAVGEPVDEPASEPAAVVTGIYDEPVLAQVSRPAFTVTIGQPEIVKGKDTRVVRAPGTGRYLVFPVTFTALPGAQGLLDILDADQFVLIPADATELTPTFAAIDGSLTLAAVSADEPETGLIAFDTRAKSGMLQLRDDAGDVMIEWSVSGAN